MPRGRKRQESLSLEEKLDDVVAQIDTTEETLKNLKNQKKEIEKQIKEQKKEQLYQTVMNSGKTIEEILEVLKAKDDEKTEQK